MSETHWMADLWATTEAPARDLAFVLAVEERIVRRRMLMGVALRLGAGLALVAGLAASAPVWIAGVESYAGSLDAAGPALAAVAAIGAILIRLVRGPGDSVFGDLEETGESLA